MIYNKLIQNNYYKQHLNNKGQFNQKFIGYYGVARFSQTMGKCDCGGIKCYDYKLHNWFCNKCNNIWNNFNGFGDEMDE